MKKNPMNQGVLTENSVGIGPVSKAIQSRRVKTKMMKADGIITRLGIASGGWWMRIP